MTSDLREALPSFQLGSVFLVCDLDPLPQAAATSLLFPETSAASLLPPSCLPDCPVSAASA